VVFVLIFYVVPIALMVGESFSVTNPTGTRFWTLENYQKFMGDPYYFEIVWRSIRLSLLATAVSLVLGYPAAYYLSRCGSKERQWLILLILVPLTVSLIIRTFGWLIVLGPGGLVNTFLKALGLPSVKLLYVEPAVVIGYAHVFLPFMVLAVLTSLQGIERDLVRAAHNLGATPWQAFRRVTFPLTMPGIMAGSVIVFALSISSFVVPSIMGGPKVRVLAYMVYEQQILLYNRSFGAAIAFVLLALTTSLLIFANRAVERKQYFGAGG
jgi:putative spermidine/putrescine transport system permease protein